MAQDDNNHNSGRLAVRIVDWAKRSSFLHLLIVITLAAEILTSLLNVVNYYTWWGEHPIRMFVLGVLDAFLVSVIALPAIILIIMRLKQAEQESAAKSSYLDNILRTSTDLAIAATDMDFRVTLFNPAAEEMFGYKAEEVIGSDVRQLRQGKGIDPERFAAALDAIDREGEYAISMLVPHGWGLRQLELRISGIRDGKGRQSGYVLMARDVTERLKYEKVIRESEEKFRNLVENSLVGVYIIQDDRFVYVNPRFTELVGYDRDEIIGGMRLEDIIAPEYMSIVRENISKRLAGLAESAHYKLKGRRKDGTVIDAEVLGSITQYEGKPAIIGTLIDITERVKAEDEVRRLNEGLERRVAERTVELRKSEARYRMLMEQASDGIGIMGPDGRISSVNRRMCEMLGYTEQELMNLRIDDLFTPDEMPLVIADIEILRAGGSVLRDRTVRRKDGTTLQAEVSAKLLDDGSVLAIGRDITARKEAEQALRRSEERLRHVVQHMPVMMAAFGEDGTILVWNRECERVTGYMAEEIVGRPDALKLLYPDEDYREAMLAEWGRRGNNYRGWEWELTCKDGSVRTVAWSSVSDVISIPGWPVWGIAIDVTEHNRARDELKRSEASYRAMAKNLPGIVYRVFVREGGRMQFFNDMLEPLTGYAAGDLCPGTNCSIDPIIVPEDREGVVEQVKKAMAEDRPFLLEYRIAHKSGETRYLQERGRPVRGKDGRPLYIDGVIIDMTEFKMAQIEREAIQARLNESQKMEAIGNLAGGIAHDFNNLLTVIQGDNMLVKSEVGSSHPAIEHIEHIDAAASRASELIKKLMLFSRKQKMARKAMDLNEAVEDILAVVMRLIGSNIDVKSVVGPDVWPVNADVSGVEQVVMNLVLNARDAMPDGGSLKVSTENVELDEEACRDKAPAVPGRYVRLSVADTGVGMDDETRTHVFEPFFTTKGKGRGTGLGLSVVYGIVREHGGWIDVASEPGRGSRFDVYFPASA